MYINFFFVSYAATVGAFLLGENYMYVISAKDERLLLNNINTFMAAWHTRKSLPN